MQSIKHCEFINIPSKSLEDNKFSRSYLELKKQDVRDEEQAL